MSESHGCSGSHVPGCMTMVSLIPPGTIATLHLASSRLSTFALSMGLTPSHHQKWRVPAMYIACPASSIEVGSSTSGSSTVGLSIVADSGTVQVQLLVQVQFRYSCWFRYTIGGLVLSGVGHHDVVQMLWGIMQSTDCKLCTSCMPCT